MKTAILIDGGYYRKVALGFFGEKNGKEAANQLVDYCMRHLKEGKGERAKYHDLYRIFYYDCPPSSQNVYHPVLKKTVNLSQTDTFKWMSEFLKQLKRKRKVALRLGKLSESQTHYTIKYKIQKKIMDGSLSIQELDESCFQISFEQKGVDMKIGLDIASLAFKKQVDQIILISGDSDFVPASKLARREGIDFILDPLGRKIKEDLFEHIDGLRTRDKVFKIGKNEENTSDKV